MHDFLASVTHNPHGRHRKKRVYATARAHNRSIVYNPLWWKDENFSHAFQVDLVLHEIGHIFNRIFLDGRGHDAKWKRIGDIVGYTPIGGTTQKRRVSHRNFARLVGKFDVAEEMIGKIGKVKRQRQQSMHPSPVARALEIFTHYGELYDRKDLIAMCIEEGINRNTASTQYWRWNNGRV